MTNEQTRANFEAHIDEMIVSEAGLGIALQRDYTGAYEISWVQLGWLYWQAATLKERERCALVCERQIKIFLSTEYKTGQPLSSFGERHAAASCAEAIRMPPTGTEGAEL